MNGKLQVISAILKLDKQFRPPHIIDMTGLDRQLVRYHLGQFVEKDLLERIDKYYIIKDREGLLNSLIESSEQIETALPKPGGIFASVDGMNVELEAIVAAKSLNLPMHREAKDRLIKALDESVSVLKQMRKYLTNATKTESSARKFFFRKEATNEDVWMILTKRGASGFDLQEFSEAFEKAMIDNE